jgi:DNA-binding NtrC family response regulator
LYCYKKIDISKFMQILVSWIGTTDLNAADRAEPDDLGPVGTAVVGGSFDAIWLLANQPEERLARYEAWLREQRRDHKASLRVRRVQLRNPANFEEVYETVTQFLEQELRRYRQPPELTFHLSPGTPAMSAIWVILGRTQYRANLIQSSRRTGVEVVSLPFEISMSRRFFADVVRTSDERLTQLNAGEVQSAARFGDMIYSGDEMRRLVMRAKRAAVRSVPILIEGESGTGKELLARAIHLESPRAERTLQVINCGAIPSDLVESELFGHVKGAFTGAIKDRVGCFEAANGGTLFLDEISELPLQAQVKLLRVLQEGEVTRVGATKPIKVNVRVIAASNKDLGASVAAGGFRADLFYRLAVLVLKVPPLRERGDDIDGLISGLLERINRQSEDEPGFRAKTISPEAKVLLGKQAWPGNVRELENTLRRAAVWSDKQTISDEDVRDALMPAVAPRGHDGILNRPLEGGVDLPALVGEVSRHYLQRALERAAGNKSKAAEMVGLPSYQTLTNWLRKHGVPEDFGRPS